MWYTPALEVEMRNLAENVAMALVGGAVLLMLGGGSYALWHQWNSGAAALEYPTGKLVRVVDCEAEVVCFRYVGFEGVSCVPLSQTPLCCAPEEEE